MIFMNIQTSGNNILTMMSKYKSYVDTILLGPKEQEVRMLFTDGLAVEVDEQDNMKQGGYILTYPLRGDVVANDEMMEAIRDYCDRDDYSPYDIALKYGVMHNLSTMFKQEANKAWLVIIDDWNAEIDIVETSDEELSKYGDTEAFVTERLQYDISHIHWVLCNENPKINRLTPSDYEE